MGHAIHFLQRLERVSESQLEFALALYRDSAMVRYAIASCRLPEGAERVALALENAPGGPHIIVTRDGRFVTCLAAGMRLDDTPVIRRSQLDRWMTQVDGMREAVGDLRQRGGVRKLYNRLFRAGCNLSREDFTALRTIHPLISLEIHKTLAGVAKDVIEFRTGFRPGRYRLGSARTRDRLRRYWQDMWTVGHLITLQGVAIDDWLTFWRGQHYLPEDEVLFLLAWSGTRTACTPIILRAAWAMARAGREALSAFKPRLRDAQTFAMYLTSAVGITAVGLRHRRLRAECLKALGRNTIPILDPEPELETADHIMARTMADLLRDAAENSNVYVAGHRDLGSAMAVELGEQLAPDDPMRFTRPEDVPGELADALPLIMESNILSDLRLAPYLVMTVPWAAQASAEAMYLPQEFLETYSFEFSAAQVHEQLCGHDRYYGQRPRRYADRKPGRNQLCPCGSEKKYKRCCAA